MFTNMDRSKKGHTPDKSHGSCHESPDEYDMASGYDTVSTTSDYIVIEAGNDKSDPRVTCENYNVNGHTVSRTSDPDSNGTVDHGFEDDSSYSSVKAAVSVEEEMHQRFLKSEQENNSEKNGDLHVPCLDVADGVDSHNIFDVPQFQDAAEPDAIPPHVIQESTDALMTAVKNDAPHTIDDLIDKSSTLRVYTAFLSSITLGRDHISKMFVEHPKYETLSEVTSQIKSGRFHNRHVTDKDDSDLLQNHSLLSAQMTPIMLASLKNQYEIVQALMNKGERIDEPHSLTCSCDDCDQLQTDQLRAAKLRLNTYRSLSCNTYVVLANEDPIYAAFELRQKLMTLSNKEKHYMAEYQLLADQISNLAGMILDSVVDGKELDTLLNEKSGSGLTTYDNLARLKLAIRYKEKKFVAHPACQKKLASMWIGSLNPKWVDGVGNSVMFFILLTIAYPFMVIPYWLWPKNKMSDFLRIPIVKFTGSTSAYFVFMGILMASSFSENPSTGFKMSTDPEVGQLYNDYLKYTPTVLVPDQHMRFHHVVALNMLLCVWLLGMIWENVKKIFHEGTTFFTDNMFNLLNFTSLGFYVVSFGFRFYAFAEVEESVQYFSKQNGWEALAKNDTEALDKIYWLSADRRTWRANDPTFIAEAVYSLASIFSITKITYVFTISERLGPLLISLVKMMEDVFAFMVLFVFIIVAFVVGFHNLYWYYYNSDHIVNKSEVTFTSIAKVIELFFWSIFGLVELDDGKFSTHNKSELTSIMAYVLFAIYNWMMVIILINMLIAMMSRSYDVISEMEDTEWKFARTKLFLEYMRDDSTIAYPYNLVPTWKGVYLLCKSFADDWCYRLAGRPPRKLRSTKLPSKKPTPQKQKDLELLAIADERDSTSSPEGGNVEQESHQTEADTVNHQNTSHDSDTRQDVSQHQNTSHDCDTRQDVSQHQNTSHDCDTRQDVSQHQNTSHDSDTRQDVSQHQNTSHDCDTRQDVSQHQNTSHDSDTRQDVSQHQNTSHDSDTRQDVSQHQNTSHDCDTRQDVSQHQNTSHDSDTRQDVSQHQPGIESGILETSETNNDSPGEDLSKHATHRQTKEARLVKTEQSKKKKGKTSKTKKEMSNLKVEESNGDQLNLQTKKQKKDGSAKRKTQISASGTDKRSRDKHNDAMPISAKTNGKKQKNGKSRGAEKKSDKVVPSGCYKVVIREVITRFIQKRGVSDDGADATELLANDLSGLRQELMTNIFRQDEERAAMATNIINIQKDMNISRETFTLQHAYLKQENESRIAEIKSEINDIQIDICKTMTSMKESLICFKNDVASQLKETKEQMFRGLQDVHVGMCDLGKGLETQAQSVSNIHGTLEKQVSRVNTIHGTLSHLRSDVNTVQGTLAQSVFTQGDMEIIDVDGRVVDPRPEAEDIQPASETSH